MTKKITQDILETLLKKLLTLLEKVELLLKRMRWKASLFENNMILNSRNELVTKCRHENKFYFANLKDNM